MATNERIRKYLDAGTVLGQVSRGRAEEIVRELVNAGDIQRNHAQEWVDTVLERSRTSREHVVGLVRHEVATQLERIDGTSLEAVAAQVAELLKRSAKAGHSATSTVSSQAGKAGKVAKDLSAKATQTATDTATKARDAAVKVAPTSIPSMPSMPSMPSVPNLPSIQNIPGLQNIPGFPSTSPGDDPATKKAAS
jgi:polyhydroxyalkanoate synthesis regulator phasin